MHGKGGQGQQEVTRETGPVGDKLGEEAISRAGAGQKRLCPTMDAVSTPPGNGIILARTVFPAAKSTFYSWLMRLPGLSGPQANVRKPRESIVFGGTPQGFSS